jgi:hypothetical protein
VQSSTNPRSARSIRRASSVPPNSIPPWWSVTFPDRKGACSTREWPSCAREAGAAKSEHDSHSD